MYKIGVFGASFNPPTLGHQDVIAQALPVFDEILLVPSLSHPFGKTLAPISHRLKMLNLFIQDAVLKNNQHKVKILNIEETLLNPDAKEKPIYTFDVLEKIESLYQSKKKSCQISFILGPDNSKKEIWQKFYRYKEIEKKWPLFIAKENFPIHSTMVRDSVKNYLNKSALKIELIKWVSESIANYIIDHQLYQSTIPKTEPLLTVDTVVFAIHEEKLCVLVVKRQEPPFVGRWALPASKVDISIDENLEQTAKRCLKQRFGVDIRYLEQVQTLGNNHRDTRGWSVAVVYYGIVQAHHSPSTFFCENHELTWLPVDEALNNILAFDHQLIVESCLSRFQNKSLYTSLPIFLLSDEFTLTDLQRTYEMVLGFKMEKKSFRRRLLDAGFLQETGHWRRASHRPALLYRLSQHQPYFFQRIIEGVRDSKSIE